jgi:hypothetical protein
MLRIDWVDFRPKDRFLHSPLFWCRTFNSTILVIVGTVRATAVFPIFVDQFSGGLDFFRLHRRDHSWNAEAVHDARHSKTYAPPDDLLNPPRRPDSKGYIPCRTIDSVPPRKTRCLLTSAGR